jgi:hypothetical protein
VCGILPVKALNFVLTFSSFMFFVNNVFIF